MTDRGFPRVRRWAAATASRRSAQRGTLGATPGFVYGIDVSRFQDSDGDGIGDLEGVRRRLEYVAWLGAAWIWLLPIYVSPRRDNGYDVVDHRRTDARLGSIDQFHRLVHDAHSLGIRVMVDLVVHHTSDEHPWFRGAVEGDAELQRRYVWAGPPKPPEVEKLTFPGEESSVWTFQPEVGRFYRHLFYSHEPDLNLAELAVRRELLGIAEHWVGEGVDGFRVDAAPHILDGGDLGKTDFGFYDDLRRAVGSAVVIGETDVPLDETASYYANNRFDGLLSFALNNATFLALARDDPWALEATLDAAPQLDRGVTFLRNADELDLDQLKPDERREVFEAFAPSPQMQLYGRGIRRALAPMLGEGIDDAFGILFDLPGLPLVMAGQELGLGEQLDAPNRDAVRLSMQWNATGGFTTAPSSPFVLPVQRSGPWAAEHINAADQLADQGSLLQRFRGVVAARNARVVGG